MLGKVSGVLVAFLVAVTIGVLAFTKTGDADVRSDPERKLVDMDPVRRAEP